VGASVVAHGDAAPVLETVKGILDAVALAVEGTIEGKRHLPAAGGRDAGLDTLLPQRLSEAVAIIATVADEMTGWQ
jgi:hypothetical protein